MMTPRNSRISRTIQLLVAICLVSWSAQGGYGGSGTMDDPNQIAMVQDFVTGSSDPNQWGPLAPPSGHWVFSEPISVQTKLVTIVVSVVDAENNPMGYTQVLAYCEPWDFTRWEWTDASGSCRIVGPIGDYTFYASSGEILAASERITISEDTTVSLIGTDSTQIAFVDPNGSSFAPAGQGPWWCWFTPTNFPSPTGPYHAGYVYEGKALRWTTPFVNGVLSLMRAPVAETPGYIIFQDFSGDGSGTYVVDEQELGCVRFHLKGLACGETVWVFWFDEVDSEVTYHHVWGPSVPSSGGTVEVRLMPGLYRVHTVVHLRQSDGSLVYGGYSVPLLVNVEPNGVRELHFGGSFEAKLNILRWDPGYVIFWIDILDSLGNYLSDVRGTATLRLKRGTQVLFEGPVQDSWGRGIGFYNPLADDMKQGGPVEYEYQFSSPVLGLITTSGVLPSPDTQLHQGHLAGQSPHFTLHSPHPAPYANEVLQLLECAYMWLVREYSGPFSPQSMGRFDVLYGAAPGYGGCSGDQFGIDLYSGFYMTGDADQTGVLYHEFVHGCQASLVGQLSEQGFAVRPSIYELIESQANLVAMYLARVIHGERTFRMHRQSRSNQFFSAIENGTVVPEVDRYIFPWIYVDARYGQAVNRDFFRAVYANERNLGSILQTMDFLKTESERTATLYSYLANDNLAWLYRWAGFEVSDEIVNQGVAYIRSCLAADGYIVTSDPGTSNLAAYYKLDGDAQDSSGSGNNGTLVGNPTWVSAGKVGGALQFNGLDYVECGAGPSLNITDAVTISAWIRLAGPTADQKIAGNQDGVAGGYKLGVYSDRVEFEIRTPENSWVLNRDVAGGTVLTPNVWYHVAGVYSKGSYIATYVNGVLDRVLATSALLGSTTGTFKIGREPFWWGNFCFWNGMIDDLRVYNRTLAPAEIAYLADETPDDGKLDVPPQQ